jgi:hypothetical protein
VCHACSRKAHAAPASQAPLSSHNSQGNTSSSQGTSSSWGTSSDSDSEGEGPENGNSSGTAVQGRSRQLKAPSQSQPAAAAAGSSRLTTAAAAAGAASAASILPGQQPEQQHLLLQPSFRPAAAWQYSSSNLLRLSQGWGKRRVKPVVNPEALLKCPAVTLKQLSLSLTVDSAGLVQVRLPGPFVCLVLFV